MEKSITGRLFLFMFLLFVSMFAQAQGKASDTQNNYYDYEVLSLGVGQDGTKIFTIKVTAKKIEEGVELAKRNAIAACLFKGIEGTGQTGKTPAIVPQGITSDNQVFFEDFLKLKDKKGNGGKYLRFISRTGKQNYEKNKKDYSVTLEVQVSYNDLRNYMINEGMAKSMDFLF